MGKARNVIASAATGSKWTRKDGRVGASVTITYRDRDTGREIKKRSSTTRKSEEEADEWLLRRRHDALEGKIEAPPEASDTLRSHLETWLRDVVEPRVSPNTLQKRVWAASNHIAPALGDLELRDVSPRRVSSFYSRLSREGYALATRREIHVTLRMALEQAVRWQLIPSNPCDLVDAPKQAVREYREDEEEIRALTDEQAIRLFEETAEKRWHNYYVAAIRTGLRPGEMLALRWSDVDLSSDPASIRVRRTLDTHHAARFGPPKSDASRRTVALHFEAAEAFERQRRMLEAEGLPTGAGDLVFPSKVGTPMQATNLRRRHLQPDLAAAGLPKLTLHELRHTYASIALHEWQLPHAIVQQALGHTSIKMTMDLYGHLMPSAQADAMRKINQMYRSQDRKQA